MQQSRILVRPLPHRKGKYENVFTDVLWSRAADASRLLFVRGLKRVCTTVHNCLLRVQAMDQVRVFRSILGRPKGAQQLGEDEEGYDSDLEDINDKGAFNFSGLSILRASELVEPAGWFLGRKYYVVTRGATVGIFHRL